MAKGDAAIDLQQIAGGARLTIRPLTASEEWIIQNLYYGGAVELHMVNDTLGLDLTFDTDSGRGARLGYTFIVTNTIYLELENVTGDYLHLGYSGVITKE